MKQPVAELKNIGPVSAQWLRAVGIHTLEELAALGAVEAYRCVGQHGLKPSLNLLYALEGALRDLHWTALPVNLQQKLRAAARQAANE